ncbi:hypothetical protein F5X98DRAFT_383792 [Xylaria grammica]|nr:hypothetical protein F5X98DRAFT_383792 [Xylaria grammica]
MTIPKIARNALFILGSLLKRPHSKHNLDSCLLQLPPELILYIADFLSPSDLILFSQTCYPLRAILQKYINTVKLSRTEYLSYLAAHAREDPRKWVCGKCMTLHPVVGLDTPAANLQRSSCPRRSHGEIRYDNRLYYGQIRLEHHHIQLALKYTRLQKYKYNSYLRALLAPHYDPNFSPRNNAQLKTHYSAYPKIATAHNGNLTFLLLSTWRYHKGLGNISFDNIGYLPICPHVMIHPFRTWGPHDPSYGLQEALKMVLGAKGDRQEHTGACPRCATDFSVRLNPRFLDLHVWQDFGPEGSPGDLAWETHCDGIGLDGVPNCGDWGHILYHEPGTIRKLYGDYGKCESQAVGARLANKAMGIFNQMGLEGSLLSKPATANHEVPKL